MSNDTLARLAAVLEERKNAEPGSSYVASLYHKGLNKILEKVGEESVETILAAKDAAISGDNRDLIYETADLWFHSMVMLAALGEHFLQHAARAFRVAHVEVRAREGTVHDDDPARGRRVRVVQRAPLAHAQAQGRKVRR